MDERPYRHGVGVILVNTAGHVFVGQRIDTQEFAWQMPQGGIDDGETATEAVLRELQEETGTDKAIIVAESVGWFTYDLPANVADKIWQGRFRGQKQKWFVLRFMGTDADIDINGPHPEFATWRWVAPQELPSLIVSFKREMYAQIIDEMLPEILAAHAKDY